MSKSKTAREIFIPFEIETQMCDECGGVTTETKEGDTVCKKCGLVQNQKNLDLNNPPRRMYNQEEREVLNKNAPRPDFGHRTNIGGIYSKGVRNKGLYTRLSRINKNVINSYERTLWFTKRICFNFFGHFRIPEIIQNESWSFFRKIVKDGFLRGYSSELTFAAIVYIMCRRNSYPVFAHEIAQFYNLKRTQFNHSLYKFFTCFNVTMPPMDLKAYISRVCSDFNIRYKNGVVEKMLKASKSEKGLDPKGIIAAIVYLLGAGSVSQQTIADFLGISEVTLRSRKTEILQKIKKLNREGDILCRI